MLRDTKYYVYEHRLEDGTIFYIGKGSGDRAFSTKDRNYLWKQVVKENKSYIVNIKEDNLTNEEALDLEIKTIKEIGMDNLTNLTEGGEGTDNSKLPPEKYKEWIKNKSIAQTGAVGYYRGKKRPNHSQKMKELHKKGKYNYKHLKNKVISEETKKKMSLAKKGLTFKKKYCKLCDRNIPENNFYRHLCNPSNDPAYIYGTPEYRRRKGKEYYNKKKKRG